jgi:hypothetical protein
MRPPDAKENAATREPSAAHRKTISDTHPTTLPATLCTREAAKMALSRVVTVATHPDVPPALRAELGLAGRFLQSVLEHDVLPPAGGAR